MAVPPPDYGGTELVVDQLARGLVAAGQQVTLFTTGDATCPVERRWSLPEAVGTTASLYEELGHVQAAYRALGRCDVVHDHTLLGPMWASTIGFTSPVVTTAHGELTSELAELFAAVGRHVAVIAISEHQRATAPRVPVSAVIHHGIDVDAQIPGEGDGGYVAFLGRMHPDKGVHRAIHVARAAGKRLRIAAKMWEPIEVRYFEQVVRPLLGEDVEYVGQVGGPAKHDLLAGAEALLNPIRWPEPFGLVMIEALAVGTPVLAFPEGAAPEIVDHGTTGFLCADEDDMAARLADVGSIDRRACRRAALDRFSTRRMVEDHLRLYRQLVESHARVVDLRAQPGSAAAGTADLPQATSERRWS
ncbi:MAG TPA: glycosyltransferase family 4 protein [Acidimicrobiales bacterium]|nr:glycosyltransferase family 4 protein [Acidimicrobiales bacterium]